MESILRCVCSKGRKLMNSIIYYKIFICKMTKSRYPTSKGRGWLPRKNGRKKLVVTLPNPHNNARHHHLGDQLELCGGLLWKRQDWIFLPFSWLCNIFPFHIASLPLFLLSPLPPLAPTVNLLPPGRDDCPPAVHPVPGPDPLHPQALVQTSSDPAAPEECQRRGR